MYLIDQPKELLKKKLESSKADAALIDQRLAALKGKEVPTSTLLALRSVSRMYRDNIEVLKQAIRNTRSRRRKISLTNATRVFLKMSDCDRGVSMKTILSSSKNDPSAMLEVSGEETVRDQIPSSVSTRVGRNKVDIDANALKHFLDTMKKKLPVK